MGVQVLLPGSRRRVPEESRDRPESKYLGTRTCAKKSTCSPPPASSSLSDAIADGRVARRSVRASFTENETLPGYHASRYIGSESQVMVPPASGSVYHCSIISSMESS